MWTWSVSTAVSTGCPCSVQGVRYPVYVHGNVGVDPGQVGPRTADAPADEADDLEPAVDGHHEGAPAVPLAAVPAPVLVTRAQEVLGVDSLLPAVTSNC